MLKYTYDKSRIGARIKELRNLFDITASELSEILDVSVEYLSLVERGSRGFSQKVLVKLSEYFNTSLDYIILGKTTNSTSIRQEPDILHDLPNADYAFIIKICKILTYRKCSIAELDYLENMIKCYFKYRTEKEKSGM